jgi:hypothetical protein
MSSLVIKTRTETLYWMFTRPDFAVDALAVYRCDNNDFMWKLNLPTGSYQEYQP